MPPCQDNDVSPQGRDKSAPFSISPQHRFYGRYGLFVFAARYALQNALYVAIDAGGPGTRPDIPYGGFYRAGVRAFNGFFQSRKFGSEPYHIGSLLW
jgi:hypothetical protein